MRIALGSDHAGYEAPQPLYKPELLKHLTGRGHEVVDCGTDSADSVDYPDIAKQVCESVLAGDVDRGLLLCGTGIGMSIAANRYAGIRAANCVAPDMARLSRTHNDANVLCIGKRTLPLAQCLELVDIWLDTPFSEGERHKRRVSKLG